MQGACRLIIDARERNVLRHEVELKEINYSVHQITTGDYVILCPRGTILAVLERKSLEDFAASLKDGRHDNKQKMVALRDKCGCKIVYLIEGRPPANPGHLVGGIAYRNIESAIFHLILRDNITVLFAQDTLDSAKILVRFVQSATTLCNKWTSTCEIASEIADETVSEIPQDPLPILTQPHERSEREIVRAMWAELPGIAVTTADEYMIHWSLADAARGMISHEALMDFKLASGRRCGKKARISILALSTDTGLQIRVLAAVPRISRAAAKELIAIGAESLGRLLSYPADALAMRKIGATRRLGEALAAKILLYFNYKHTAATPEIRPTGAPC